MEITAKEKAILMEGLSRVRSSDFEGSNKKSSRLRNSISKEGVTKMELLNLERKIDKLTPIKKEY